jgi:phosphoribosylanthranilate isomerase
MTWVKVCGITSREALDAAVDAGADAVGFVIDRSSPRFLTIPRIRELSKDVVIERIIVSVDLETDRLMEVVAATGATGVQAHGRMADASAAVAVAAGLRALRPVPVPASGTVDVSTLPVGAVPLFDTGLPGRHGGTGRAFDWGVVAGFEGALVLAGGLGADNVARAIGAVAPWGVDASSRLESAPGRKDPDTIRSFVWEAKNA